MNQLRHNKLFMTLLCFFNKILLNELKFMTIDKIIIDYRAIN